MGLWSKKTYQAGDNFVCNKCAHAFKTGDIFYCRYGDDFVSIVAILCSDCWEKKKKEREVVPL